MAETLSQYKSNLTPEKVDQALHKLAENDVGNFVTRADLLQIVYPVGSIYISANNVSPQTFLGGTWQAVKDVFLLAAGDTYKAGNTGGEAAHTLSQAELPNYNLSVSGGDTVVYSRNGENPAAYAQTTGSGWGLPNWGVDNVQVASGGSDQAHNNMPPYLAVYVWQRTA